MNYGRISSAMSTRYVEPFQISLCARLTCNAQEYVRTGYVWEQYDANNGEGRRRYDLPCNFFQLRITC